MHRLAREAEARADRAYFAHRRLHDQPLSEKMTVCHVVLAMEGVLAGCMPLPCAEVEAQPGRRPTHRRSGGLKLALFFGWSSGGLT